MTASRATSSGDQKGSKQGKRGQIRKMVSAVLRCDCDEPFFQSEEEMEVATAYTKRLRMMHEKAPFDDIQVLKTSEKSSKTRRKQLVKSNLLNIQCGKLCRKVTRRKPLVENTRRKTRRNEIWQKFSGGKLVASI